MIMKKQSIDILNVTRPTVELEESCLKGAVFDFVLALPETDKRKKQHHD
jgi:hypothetical protein